MFFQYFEFGKKYYNWCKQCWMQEISNRYSLLGLTQSDDVICVLKTMDKDIVSALAMGLIKRNYTSYFDKINEKYTLEEQKLVQSFLDKSWEVHQQLNIRNFEKMQSAKCDKRVLKKQVFQELSKILGDNINSLGGGEYEIVTNLDGYSLSTHIDFILAWYNGAN